MPTSSPPGAAVVTDIPVDVYGASWCEDTSRTRRLLRRLGIPHSYWDVDEDLEALERATVLNNGVRRTPVVTIADGVLVEPTNDALAACLVDRRLLTRAAVDERLHIQNVGDAERCLRVASGLALVAAAPRVPRLLRAPVRLLGGLLLVSGTAGWCPLYQAARVSSLNGPGDRPQEAERHTWLRPAPGAAPRVAAAPAHASPHAPAQAAATGATPAVAPAMTSATAATSVASATGGGAGGRQSPGRDRAADRPVDTPRGGRARSAGVRGFPASPMAD